MKDRVLKNKAKQLAEEELLSLLLPKDCEKETVEKMRSFLKKGILDERYIMVNIEIKARCHDQDRIREILKSRNALFQGTDHQTDTYFKVKMFNFKKGLTFLV
jgi:ATP-dependent protease HslVU (ClpYQ) ATPase subunit